MEKEKNKITDRLRKKYRIVVYNNDTYEEKIHFKLTLMNIINIVIFSSVLLIVLVTYLIAFTPLREYIPGYTDVSLNRRVYEMEQRADSLELVFKQKDLYINNLKKIIIGDDFDTDSINSLLTKSSSTNFNNISDKRSKNDSLYNRIVICNYIDSVMFFLSVKMVRNDTCHWCKKREHHII